MFSIFSYFLTQMVEEVHHLPRQNTRGRLAMKVCVCSACGVCVYVVYERGEKKGILYLVTDMLIWNIWDVSELEISSWLFESLSLLFRIGTHLFTSRELLVLRNSDIKWSYLRRQPAGILKEEMRVIGRKDEEKKKVASEVKCCWEINNKEDWKMLFDKMYFGAELMWSRTGVVWRVSEKRRQGTLDVNRSF